MRMNTFFRAVTACVALAAAPFASVIAESGIETTRSCRTCDEPSHGGLYDTSSFVWESLDIYGQIVPPL